MSNLLTIKEASEQLGIAEITLRRKVCAREIQHIRMGRLIKFKPEFIQSYIEKTTVPVGTEAR